MAIFNGSDRISRRPLHMIWIIDCSRSMVKDGRLDKINRGIRLGIEDAIKFEKDCSPAQILMSAVRFSDGAEWHVGDPTPVTELDWPDISGGGAGKHSGEALSLVADRLKVENIGERMFRPILVLITDGNATDDLEKGLGELKSQPWGRASSKYSIYTGIDGDNGDATKFCSPSTPVRAPKNGNDILVEAIRMYASIKGGYSVWLVKKDDSPSTVCLPRYGGSTAKTSGRCTASGDGGKTRCKPYRRFEG